MFKFLRGLVTLVILLSSTATFAHPGQHATLSWSELVEHFISSPYHSIGLVAVAAFITAAVIWRVKRN